MSLSQQLQKIQNLDRLASTRAALTQRASFLFDSKRAADLSIDDIYEIGIDGLNQLIQLNSEFSKYLDSLFSPKSKHADRLHQTKQETEALDIVVQEFLIMLAPHFLTNPAGKALEWLIRRFRIEEFNSTDLIAAMLPYHNTKAFLTLLTVARIDKQSFNLLAWVLPFRKSRQLLDRYTVVNELKRSKPLFTFINNFCIKVFQQGHGYETMYTFYSALNSEYIDSLPKIDDFHIIQITPYIFQGLAVQNEGVQVATYLILCALSSRTFFIPQVFEKIILRIVNSAVNRKLAALCLLKFCENQKITESLLTDSLFNNLAKNPDFLPLFNEISGEYSVYPIMEQFLFKAASVITRPSSLACNFVNQFLLQNSLYGSFKPAFFQNLVLNYSKYWLELGNVDASDTAAAESNSENKALEFGLTLTSTLKSVYSKFINEMENAISFAIEETNKLVSSSEYPDRLDLNLAFKKLYELACTSIDSNKGLKSMRLLPVQSIGTCLYIGLNNALPNIRLASAKELYGLVSSIDFIGQSTKKPLDFSQQEVSDLIVDRLKDEEQPVVDEIFRLKLSNYLEPLDLVNAMEQLTSSKSNLPDEFARKVFNQILNKRIFSDRKSGTKAILLALSFILDPKFSIKESIGVLDQVVSKTKDHGEYTATSDLNIALLSIKATKDICFPLFYSKVVNSLATGILKSFGINSDIKCSFLDAMSLSKSKKLKTAFLLVCSIIFSTLKKTFDHSSISHTTKSAIELCMMRLKHSSNYEKNSVEIIKSGNLAIETASAENLNWEVKIVDLINLKPQSVDTTSALFTLMALISNLNKPESYIPNNWMQYYQTADDQSDYLVYCDILNEAYISCLEKNEGLTPMDGLILGYLYEKCFQGEWAQFLSRISLSSNVKSNTRVWSLLILATYLQSSVAKASTPDQVIDYQVLIPALLVCLSSPDNQTRVAAMSCFRALEKVYGTVFKLGDTKSNKKKHSKADGLDLFIFKSAEFYGNASTGLKFLPSSAVSEIVAAITACSNEFESNRSFVSSFLGMTTGSIKSSTKPIRKLYTSGYGDALVSMVFSHALCLNSISYSNDFVMQFELGILRLIQGVINESNAEMVQDLISQQMKLLTEKVGIPTLGGLEDQITKKSVSFFNKAILNAKASTKLKNNKSNDSSLLSPWEQYLDLINVGSIKDSTLHSLEKVPFENWERPYKARAFLQNVAFSHFRTSVASALDLEKQGQALGLLLSISSKGVLSNYIPGNAVFISQLLISLNLNPSILSVQISSWVSKLANLNSPSNTHSTKKSKSGNKLQAQSPSGSLLADIPTLVLLLELLSSQSEDIKCHSSLIAPLFELLEQILNVDNTICRVQSPDSNFILDANQKVPAEYIKQLVMTLLLNIFDNANKKNIPLENVSIRVDIVVNVLRSSTSLQSQTNALLLLASIAAQHSETVLHHVMAIFTFMGDSVLRLDDSYNLYVVHQAVEKIIPPLLKYKNTENQPGALSGLIGKPKGKDQTPKDSDEGAKIVLSVLRVFVDSLPYIPQHRRLPLFKLLIETIGCEEVGSSLFVLLLEKYSLKNSKKLATSGNETNGNSGVSAISDEYLEFCVSLAQEFSFKNGLGIIRGLLSELMLLPVKVPTDEDELEKLADSITLDIIRLNTKQQIAFRVVTTQYIAVLLDSADFKAQLSENDLTLIDTALEELVPLTLEFIVNWQSQAAELKSKKLSKHTSQLVTVVSDNSYSVLDSIVGGLEYSAFIRVIQSMLFHKNIDVLRKSIEVLVNKTGEMAGFFANKYEAGANTGRQQGVVALTSTEKWEKTDIQSLKSLTDLVPRLANFLGVSAYSQAKGAVLNYPVDIVQSSILCISTLVQHFGLLFSSKFVPMFEVIFGQSSKSKDLCLVKSQDHVIQLSVFVLVTRLIEVLETRAIQYLPKLIPSLLEALEKAIEVVYKAMAKRLSTDNKAISKKSNKSTNNESDLDKNDDEDELGNGTELLAAVLAVFETLVQKWSNFLGPYLKQIFAVIMNNKICYLSANSELILSESGGSKGNQSGQKSISKKDIVLFKKAMSKYTNLLTLLAGVTQPRMAMEALFEYFELIQSSEKQLADNSYSMFSLAKFGGYMVSSMQNEQLIKFHTPVFKLYLMMFGYKFSKQFRSEYNILEGASLASKAGESGGENQSENTDEADSISNEGNSTGIYAKSRAENLALKALVDNFVDFCVKLNESAFVPMFLSFISWATTEYVKTAEDDMEMDGSHAQAEGSISVANSFRLVVFYSVLNRLFGKLQNIFAPYYRHVIDTSLVVLNEFGIAGDSELLDIDSGAKNLNGAEVRMPNRLWGLVLESLLLSGMYDSGDLWTAEQFEKFVKPLSSQVGNTLVTGKSGEVQVELESDGVANTETGYLGRMKNYLGPAIAQLYLTVNNDAMWRQLHHAVLLKSRSQSTQVRMGSMIIVRLSFEKLAEEFLILVPETIQFLAELIDDENSNVERITNGTIVAIEGILGESLQPYFN